MMTFIIKDIVNMNKRDKIMMKMLLILIQMLIKINQIIKMINIQIKVLTNMINYYNWVKLVVYKVIICNQNSNLNLKLIEIVIYNIKIMKYRKSQKQYFQKNQNL